MSFTIRKRRGEMGLVFSKFAKKNFRSSIFVKLSGFVPFEELSKKSRVKIFLGHPLEKGEGGKF